MPEILIIQSRPKNRFGGSGEVKPPRSKISKTFDVPAKGFGTSIKRQGNYRTEATAPPSSNCFKETWRREPNKATMIADMLPAQMRAERTLHQRLNTPAVSPSDAQKYIVSPLFDGRVTRLARRWNWDGEGGRAIRLSACMDALELIRRVRKKQADFPLAIVSPSKRGAVMLTWRTSSYSLTVFFATRSARKLDYRREGMDFTYKNDHATRSQIIKMLFDMRSEILPAQNSD